MMLCSKLGPVNTFVTAETILGSGKSRSQAFMPRMIVGSCMCFKWTAYLMMAA